jgi:hypothetical protein
MNEAENRNVCSGDHVRIKCSLFGEDAPATAWPPADAPTHCVCGATLEYLHIIDELFDDATRAR